MHNLGHSAISSTTPTSAATKTFPVCHGCGTTGRLAGGECLARLITEVRARPHAQSWSGAHGDRGAAGVLVPRAGAGRWRRPSLPKGLREPGGEGGDRAVALPGRLVRQQEPRLQRGVAQAAAKPGLQPVQIVPLCISM